MGSSVPGSGGLADYFRHRPPGVLFLLCLLSFAMTTMALSFYISNQTDIGNPDVLDWNTLLLETGNLHFCMAATTGNQTVAGRSNSNNKIDDDEIHQNGHDRANISIAVALSQDWRQQGLPGFGQGMTAVSVVRLADMGRQVPHRFKEEHLVLTFALDSAAVDYSSNLLCVNVNAPKSILENVNSGRDLPENCSLHANKNKDSEIVHLPSTSAEYEAGWCEDGQVFRLELEPLSSWTVAITRSDQALIHVHLMVTSAFLFVLVGVVLLSVFVRGLFSSKRQQASSSAHQPFAREEERLDF